MAHDPVMKQKYKYGENLGGTLNIDDCNYPVDSWYKENSAYNYDTNNGDGTGHFTQVVWKASTVVGCARAKGSKGTIYVSCVFKEWGNMGGEFATNVRCPVKKSETKSKKCQK